MLLSPSTSTERSMSGRIVRLLTAFLYGHKAILLCKFGRGAGTRVPPLATTIRPETKHGTIYKMQDAKEPDAVPHTRREERSRLASQMTSRLHALSSWEAPSTNRTRSQHLAFHARILLLAHPGRRFDGCRMHCSSSMGPVVKRLRKPSDGQPFSPLLGREDRRDSRWSLGFTNRAPCSSPCRSSSNQARREKKKYAGTRSRHTWPSQHGCRGHGHSRAPPSSTWPLLPMFYVTAGEGPPVAKNTQTNMKASSGVDRACLTLKSLGPPVSLG